WLRLYVSKSLHRTQPLKKKWMRLLPIFEKFATNNCQEFDVAFDSGFGHSPYAQPQIFTFLFMPSTELYRNFLR
ncbi:MAG: hypothetical protein VW420_01345, partial [Schleiferiaceae bacterium]